MQDAPPTRMNLLEALKAAEGSYVSGPELAERLKLSRTAIWKQIQSLKALGYDIETHPRLGYRLDSAPDILVPAEVLPHLTTRWLGRNYHHHHTLGSTNDEAMQLAARGAPHGTVVIAEVQTAGKGRLQRQWVSPPNAGIYMTVIFRDARPLQDAFQPSAIIALAVVRTLELHCGLRAAIKWPNDVLLNGKKISGILSEMQSDQDITRFIVVGVGVNVNHGIEDFSGPFRYPATSAAMELGRRVGRRDFLLRFLSVMEEIYDRVSAEGFGSILPEIEAASAVLGRTVTIARGARGDITGKAVRFTPEGALVLQTEDGAEETIWVGDVLRVRNGF